MDKVNSLIEQTHTIKVFGRHCQHFKNIGVNVRVGCFVTIKSSELPINSKTIVKAICCNCKNVFDTKYSSYNNCKKGFVCSHLCRMKRTSMFLKEQFGVINVSQIPKNKEKRIATNKARFGVANISQSQKIKNKKSESSFVRYGVENISQSKTIKDKKKETLKKNYGVEFPMQSKRILNKHIANLQAKYGKEITNVSQLSFVMDKKIKKGISTKDFVLPSGKVVRLQGYEDFAIKYLLESGISECDMVIGNKNIESIVGSFWFDDVLKNKKRRYFPDIFIISENKIYEVKSKFTMTLDQNKILSKKQCVLDRGFNFGFIIFDGNNVVAPPRVE